MVRWMTGVGLQFRGGGRVGTWIAGDVFFFFFLVNTRVQDQSLWRVAGTVVVEDSCLASHTRHTS